MIEDLFQDIRYALRTVTKRPGFAIAAILALALGIGANTAMFSVVNAVLLRPLPFPDPHRLVVLYERNLTEGIERDDLAAETFDDWRRETKTFEQLAVWRHWGLTLSGDGEPEDIQTVRASANLFTLLDVRPALGRVFHSDEGQPGRNLVVILSHALWTQRFGADRRILGRTLTLDDQPYTVIGVMPPRFRFPDDAAVGVWTPLVYQPFETRSRNQRMFNAVGRLAPQATLETARAELATITSRVAAAYPNTNAGWTAAVEPASEVATGASREPLLVLLGAVGCVLLIACANVGNLFLARAAERQREIAVRVAMGATRWRIVRQLLAESLVIAAAGGALGLLLALWGIDLLVRLEPGHLPGWNALEVDSAVLAFTAGIALLTAFLAGLAPALHAAVPDLQAALKEGGAATASGGRRRLRRLLVVAEVALALVLLAGAGLMMKSFARLQRVDPGFDPARLLAATIYLPAHRYGDDAREIAFFAQLLDRVRALPGVASAGAVTTLPFSRQGVDHDIPVAIEGRLSPTTQQPQADFRIATPGYFETMGIPVIAGRAFDEHDRENAPPVAIVNQVLVDQLIPGEDPIGKRIRYGQTGPFVEIVGVAGQVRHRGLDAEARPELYIPYRNLSYGSMEVVVRAHGDPLSLAEPLRQAVYAVDPAQPISSLATMDNLLHASTAERRFNMVLLGSFAALALGLAALGIYAVIAYTVAQRTQEFGIRRALGARRRDVFGAVLGDGLRLVATGLVAGLVGAVALTRLLSKLLFDVSPLDPVVIGGMAVALLGTALLACVLPARRATKVEPVAALRYE